MLSVPAGRERPAGRQPSQTAHSRVPRSLGSPTPSRRRTNGGGLGQAAGGAGPLPGVGPPRLRRPRPATPPAVAGQAWPARAAAQAAAAQAHDSPHAGPVGTAHLYQLCGPGALSGGPALLPARGTLPLRRTFCNPLRAPGRCVPLAVPAPLSTTCAVLPAARGGVDGRRERPRCRPAARPAQRAVSGQGPAGQTGVSAAAAGVLWD